MYDLMFKISNQVGMIGVLCILIAYYMLSAERWQGNGLSYQFVNFIGAWFILFSLCFHWNLSSFLIEVCWILISVIGIAKRFAKAVIPLQKGIYLLSKMKSK